MYRIGREPENLHAQYEEALLGYYPAVAEILTLGIEKPETGQNPKA